MYIARTVVFNEHEFPYPSFSNTKISAPAPVVSAAHNAFSGPVFSIPINQANSDSSSEQTSSSTSSLSSPSSPPSPSPSFPTSSHNSHTTPPISDLSATHNTHNMITRAKAGVFKPKSYSVSSSLPSLPIAPKNHRLALQDSAWYKTMKTELNALKQKRAWHIIPPSPDQKLITCKWVFRVKTNADGTLDNLKARLVARGFEQMAGVDYMETFSPVVKFTTIRLVFTLAATRGWNIQQIDINNAFLNGDLEETIYMEQPPGFEDPLYPHYVCKLDKSLYGLKQAPRAWYDKLRSYLVTMGFQRSSSDFSLFFRHKEDALTLILVYVDDILVTGDSKSQVEVVIKLLHEQFALKDLGPVNYFLGIDVHQTDDQYCLNQSQYILELLERTNMADCNACSTPMSSTTKLSKSGGLPLENPTTYRSTIGALQYLTLTRPDIAYSVNKLSQFLHTPTDLHWAACKHLLRYLKGTHHFSLCFTSTSSSQFSGFADADLASSLDDRRSTGGHCIFLGSNLLVWSAKKQEVVSRSSAEFEYRSLANAATDIVWLQSLCKELSISVNPTSLLWCDNKSAIALASNPVFHARTKHIEIDVHFVREKVLAKVLQVGHVPSADQIADIFTKPLGEARFLLLRNRLRLKT